MMFVEDLEDATRTATEQITAAEAHLVEAKDARAKREIEARRQQYAAAAAALTPDQALAKLEGGGARRLTLDVEDAL